MSLTDKFKQALTTAAQSAVSVVKLALQSRPAKFPAPSGRNDKEVIVMGNGPSLRQTIDRLVGCTSDKPDLMAVNFAANTPEFFQLRPRWYVMADPHFFSDSGDENVTKLHKNLASVDWEMTLFVPRGCRKTLPGWIRKAVEVSEFNFVGIEGARWLKHKAFASGLGMPRPRNVLIPSIMIATWLGYKDIYIAGADHSWMQTLAVNDRNEVISIQPHFYKDNKAELDRGATVYRNVRLHQVVESFAVAFRSYWEIRDYADSRGVNIYNSTPGSFIDAFERRDLPV